MKRALTTTIIALIISTIACLNVWGQATAQISGTVRDQSGAVLPGVEITATQTGTNISRSAVTNETGSYVLANLALGPYRLEATLPGFRTFVQTGIVLQVNSSPAVNPILEVGQVSETVEVKANAALVETRSSAVGQVVENARILELPLNGRNVQDLMTLAGGSVKAAVVGDRVGATGAYVAVAGGVGFGTYYSLDGANHLNYLAGTNMSLPFPDATQEFKVESSGLTSQTSRPASVGVVTKSGTNEFHGDAFEFVRNDLFNARNYFATTNSTLKRNQFGGTAGGPIVRNKVFFFGGAQGTTLRQDPANLQRYVPTAAMMAGDWTDFASPACNNGRQIALRSPFVNNRISPSAYSPAAVNLAKRLPQAQNVCGLVQYSQLDIRNESQYVGKVDYQLASNNSLFGRMLLTRMNNPSAMTFNPDNVLLSTFRGNKWLQQSYAIGNTRLFGSGIVQSFRLSVNRGYTNPRSGEYFTWCDLGIGIYCYTNDTGKVSGSINVTGGFSIGSSFSNKAKYVSTAYTANDDVSWVRGNHQIGIGGDVMHGREVHFTNFGALGSLAFNGSITGLGMGDYLIGKPSQMQHGAPNATYFRGLYLGLYANDTWKMHPKLTVSYGLRWDPFLPTTSGLEPFPVVVNFDYERFKQGIRSSVFANAPTGMYFVGDPGVPKTGIDSRWWQLAPRIGFAWDPQGNGRSSIRASYGYGYAFVPGAFKEGAAGMPPWGNRLTIVPQSLDNPWEGIPGGNPFPYVVDKNAPFAPGGAFYYQPKDMKNPTTQTWNLAIQRQITQDWIASASYIGSGLRHLWSSMPENPAVFITGGPCTLNGATYNPCSSVGNTEARRRLTLERPRDGALMSFVTRGDDGGSQSYHGMVLSIERRAVQGVTVNANYTWSHCIGPYGSGLFNTSGLNPDVTNSAVNNRDFDNGNCDSDRRHIFNFTSVAQTPQFADPRLRLLVTGWRLSGIYRLSSGSPLNIVSGQDRALTATTNQRADQIVGNPYTGSSAPLANYLSPSAFALPVLGTLGNMGRNSLSGPSTWSFDMALSRLFNVREGQRLEVRIEAYNVTNSFRAGNPNTTVGSNTFGQIRTSDDPRLMQFALKYVF